MNYIKFVCLYIPLSVVQIITEGCYHMTKRMKDGGEGQKWLKQVQDQGHGPSLRHTTTCSQYLANHGCTCLLFTHVSITVMYVHM